VTGFPTGLPPGLAQTFYNCTQGINDQVAQQACTQYTGSAANCVTNTMFGQPCVYADGGVSSDLAVCNFYNATQNCVCWTYQGIHAGYVVDSGSLTQCRCAGGEPTDRPYH
jgi:hypothetical protein